MLLDPYKNILLFLKTNSTSFGFTFDKFNICYELLFKESCQICTRLWFALCTKHRVVIDVFNQVCNQCVPTTQGDAKDQSEEMLKRNNKQQPAWLTKPPWPQHKDDVTALHTSCLKGRLLRALLCVCVCAIRSPLACFKLAEIPHWKWTV